MTRAAGTEGGQKVEATLTITRELQESSAAGVCSGAGLGFPRVSVHQEGALQAGPFLLGWCAKRVQYIEAVAQDKESSGQLRPMLTLCQLPGCKGLRFSPGLGLCSSHC